jgi:hypothetical protein
VDPIHRFQRFRNLLPGAFTLQSQISEKELIANSLQSASLFLIYDENKYQDGHG